MTFAVNDSPFAGREGQFLTSRQVFARLQRELESNVASARDQDRFGQRVGSGRAW